MQEESEKTLINYKRITTTKQALQEIAILLATNDFYEKAQSIIEKGREFEYSIRIKPSNQGICVVLANRDYAPSREIRKFIKLT